MAKLYATIIATIHEEIIITKITNSIILLGISLLLCSSVSAFASTINCADLCQMPDTSEGASYPNQPLTCTLNNSFQAITACGTGPSTLIANLPMRAKSVTYQFINQSKQKLPVNVDYPHNCIKKLPRPWNQQRANIYFILSPGESTVIKIPTGSCSIEWFEKTYPEMSAVFPMFANINITQNVMIDDSTIPLVVQRLS